MTSTLCVFKLASGYHSNESFFVVNFRRAYSATHTFNVFFNQMITTLHLCYYYEKLILTKCFHSNSVEERTLQYSDPALTTNITLLVASPHIDYVSSYRCRSECNVDFHPTGCTVLPFRIGDCQTACFHRCMPHRGETACCVWLASRRAHLNCFACCITHPYCLQSGCFARARSFETLFHPIRRGETVRNGHGPE